MHADFVSNPLLHNYNACLQKRNYKGKKPARVPHAYVYMYKSIESHYHSALKLPIVTMQCGEL